MLIAIQATLLIYTNNTPENTTLWQFAGAPQNWNNTQFVLLFLGVASGITVAGLVAGSTFGFKTDFLVFAVIIGTLISWGVVFAQLYNRVFSDISAYLFGGASSMDNAAGLLTLLIVSPFALYYIWTILEWWRGKDY